MLECAIHPLTYRGEGILATVVKDIIPHFFYFLCAKIFSYRNTKPCTASHAESQYQKLNTAAGSYTCQRFCAKDLSYDRNVNKYYRSVAANFLIIKEAQTAASVSADSLLSQMWSFLFTPILYISITIPADKIICFAIDLIESPLKYKYQFQQNSFIIITFLFLVSIRNFDIFYLKAKCFHTSGEYSQLHQETT